MKNGFNEQLVKNIKENLGSYFMAVLFFTIGIAAGAFTVKALDNGQKQDLVIYLNRFFQILGNEQIKSTTILVQSLKNNFQTIFFIWLLSITIIGVPVTLFITSFRGFIVGFTISFLIQGLGWKGLLFTLVAVLPQNIIFIPCLIIISALSISFSVHSIKRKVRKGFINNVKGNMLSYTLSVGAILLIMLLGSLVEAYLSPILIKSLSAYMIVQ
ncbi:stage II sporulation protein M [Fonticella tunisiensis]|uniref:Stage II sporulation protein M n=1 Tax=Fonticella tunisiensis TaxID=1096341 RepID=A0A4R7KRE9_9CLOT|nr:stage II sporulation protein M [Fonticella tunisiensis]TDT61923.1 stage II sporulation protein M [Fonticella tunisiensis]